MTVEFIHNMPPMAFMDIILDKTAKIYMFLWGRKDKDNKVKVAWNELSHYHNKNSFRTSLRKLLDVGLLGYKETKSHVTVELVGWDQEFED